MLEDDCESSTAISEQDTRIEVTEAEYERLRNLIDTCSSDGDREAAEALANELDRAAVVAAEHIAADVVTMRSRVVFHNETDEALEVSLVYLHKCDVPRGRITALAPIGSALFGLAVGQASEWRASARTSEALARRAGGVPARGCNLCWRTSAAIASRCSVGTVARSALLRLNIGRTLPPLSETANRECRLMARPYSWGTRRSSSSMRRLGCAAAGGS
jgi:regulator of nucleoside diphosphate kinase